MANPVQLSRRKAVTVIITLAIFLTVSTIHGEDPGQQNPFQGSLVPLPKYSYRSPLGLEALAQLEAQLLYPELDGIYELFYMRKEVKGRVQDPKETKFIENLSRYLLDFESTNAKCFKEPRCPREEVTRLAVNKTPKDPLRTYRLLWRFTNYIHVWLDPDAHVAYGGKFFEIAVSFIRKYYNLRDGPSDLDLDEAEEAIIEMQFVYDLRAADIAKGIVNGFKTGIQLKAASCLDIAKRSQALDYYAIALEWIELAKEKSKMGDFRGTPPSDKFNNMINDLKYWHDKELKDERNSKPWKQLFTEPVSGVTDPAKRQWGKTVRFNELKRTNALHESPEDLYWGLCKGDVEQPSSDKSKLFCWYETEAHPAFKIGPHKVELLSRLPRPEIVMFHDLISKKALAHLKNEAKNAVFYAYRDMSGKPKNGTKIHMSSIASLPAFWATKHVDSTIDRLTGLTSNRNRQDSRLQLNLFAPAGNHHIFPQSGGTAVNTSAKQAGLASFMLYLSDTSRGGVTAFPGAFLSIQPREGSAIFWYNMKSSGEPDLDVTKGECPLIHGVKWVVTKQLTPGSHGPPMCYRRNANARFEILVNGKSKLAQ